MATGRGDGCGQPGDNYTCKGCESRKRTPAGRRNETCAAMGAGTEPAVFLEQPPDCFHAAHVFQGRLDI